MPYDSLIMGLVVLLVTAAACFYLYMRISFIERKGSMMESVIVDLRVAIDTLMNSGAGGGGSPIPISPPPQPQRVELSAPVALEASESENIPEEGFYSSVLEQAHEEAITEEAPAGISLEKAMEGMVAAAAPEAEPELDGMSKSDLMTLAEKRGLRAKKSSSREQLLALLRRSSPLQNSGSSAGAENVPGAAANGAASLDGSVNVDLGQGAALD